MSGEQRSCGKCGTPMQENQDWCLSCGAGAPGSGRRGPGWRSAAITLGATGVLVLGAAAAAYAALQQSSPSKAVAQTQTSTTSALTTSQTTAAPPVTTPAQTPPPSTVTTTSSTTAPLTPPIKPPKIPASTKTTTTKTTSTSKTTSSTTSSTATTGEETTPPQESENHGSQPLLLDADAAQVYNPRNLASGRFGDPSLAIDGDATTAWTMQLEQSEAPAVGAGLTLDLNVPLSIAQLTLITETPGITVQVYGTKSSKIPKSLESEEWVRLSRAHLFKKRKATISLSQDKQRFRQLLVWIISAPTSTAGDHFTGADVAINEIQLYEPK